MGLKPSPDEFKTGSLVQATTSEVDCMPSSVSRQLREVVEKVLEDGSKRPEAYLEGFPVLQEGE